MRRYEAIREIMKAWGSRGEAVDIEGGSACWRDAVAAAAHATLRKAYSRCPPRDSRLRWRHRKVRRNHRNVALRLPLC